MAPDRRACHRPAQGSGTRSTDAAHRARDALVELERGVDSAKLTSVWFEINRPQREEPPPSGPPIT